MFFVEELLSITMKLLKKLIILIALVIVYVFSNAVSIYIYSFKDEARTADVAIVLGASTYMVMLHLFIKKELTMPLFYTTSI